jgi:hypothetical protein
MFNVLTLVHNSVGFETEIRVKSFPGTRTNICHLYSSASSLCTAVLVCVLNYTEIIKVANEYGWRCPEATLSGSGRW